MMPDCRMVCFTDHIGRRPVALAGAVIFVWLPGSCRVPLCHHRVFLGARLPGAPVPVLLCGDVLPCCVMSPSRPHGQKSSMMNGITCIAPVLAPVIGFSYPAVFSLVCDVLLFCGLYALVSIVFHLFFIKETRPDKHPRRKQRQQPETNSRKVF